MMILLRNKFKYFYVLLTSAKLLLVTILEYNVNYDRVEACLLYQSPTQFRQFCNNYAAKDDKNYLVAIGSNFTKRSTVKEVTIDLSLCFT